MPSQTRLKEVIQASGMTYTQLAALAGISPAAMNYIANGRTLPNLRTALKLAKALGTTVEYLWSESANCRRGDVFEWD